MGCDRHRHYTVLNLLLQCHQRGCEKSPNQSSALVPSVLAPSALAYSSLLTPSVLAYSVLLAPSVLALIGASFWR